MIVILGGIMCSVLMLKLRGFKASFNLLSGKKHGGGKYEKSSDLPVLGAYRMNKEEYVINNVPNTPRKETPTIANSKQSKQRIKSSKSTSDLLSVDYIPQNNRKSTSDIPSCSRERKHSRGIKNVDSDQRKSESQKLPERNKRDKSPRKQETLKKLTGENHEQPNQEKPRKDKKKGRAPKPPINSPSQPSQYSSNTLESSISRSSGPPPYSAEVVPNQNDNTGNTSFSKPIEESSWDLVSQHREQLSRPLATSTTKSKSRVLDLHYNAGNTRTSVEVKDNSEV